MMERAADSCSSRKAASKMAAIVGARTTDGEKFSAETRQQNRIVPDTACDRSFLRDLAQSNALREIRSGSASSFAHLAPSLRVAPFDG